METNKKQRKSSTIYFYNDNKELLYKEKIGGVVMRLNNRKVKIQLWKVLDQSLVAYAAQQKVVENEMLVATLLKKINRGYIAGDEEIKKI